MLSSLLSVSEGCSYLESSCVEDEGRMCGFHEVSGRILKTTDSVVEKVGSSEECKQLCLQANYRLIIFRVEI